MAKGKRYDIFLSYSSKDRAWVSEFISALRAAGVTAWFDIEDIPIGENWQDWTLRALRESSTLIVILSHNSIRSPWMFFEIGAAVADRKRIIPIILEDTEIPAPLVSFQSIKESSASEASKRVVEAIKDVNSRESVGRESEAHPA